MAGIDEVEQTSHTPDGPGPGADPVVEYDDTQADIWALSDPHGGIVALEALLRSGQLIDASSSWSGAEATLVVAGDLIDKGSQSLEVIDLLRELQGQATLAGGRVIVTMGNHEAEFFVDPENHKATSTGEGADGIDNQLRDEQIEPADLAQGIDAMGRGNWLRRLPLAARVNNYFFAHGGNTDGASIPKLRKTLTEAFTRGEGFADRAITGNDSILEAQGWYGDPDKDGAGRDDAAALGVDHIVFGHDPGAFHERGHIAASKNHVLIKIDCAMGLDGTPGQLLHISTRAGADTAEKVKLSGERERLY